MKWLASYALFLAISSIIPPQISARGNRVTPSPSFHHGQRTVSDMTDACATATSAINEPFADPDDCMQFYFCTDAEVATPEFPLHCNDEYKCFDPNANPKVCSIDPLACQKACTSNGPQCKYECSAIGEQYADRTDCGKHYFCDTNLDPVELQCNDVSKPFFNGRECVSDRTQCCNCRQRSCDGLAAGDLIEDTDDCHSFYACIDVSGSVDLIPYGPTPCPPGQGFNYAEKKCDEASEGCLDLCNIGK